jgi:hypothetical protein
MFQVLFVFEIKNKIKWFQEYDIINAQTTQINTLHINVHFIYTGWNELNTYLGYILGVHVIYHNVHGKIGMKKLQ